MGLKYMLLCKIMVNQADDVKGILSGKLALKYTTGDDAEALNAMRAVAQAKKDRSLGDFEKALNDFKAVRAQILSQCCCLPRGAPSRETRPA